MALIKYVIYHQIVLERWNNIVPKQINTIILPIIIRLEIEMISVHDFKLKLQTAISLPWMNARMSLLKSLKECQNYLIGKYSFVGMLAK